MLSAGINTPQPIAYLEVHSRWRLQQSYFIAAKIGFDFEMRDVIENRTPDKLNILKQFTAFTQQLHQHKILHLDYSPGNILVTKGMGRYHFTVVDINRMRFGELTTKQGIQNFSRMCHDPSNTAVFAKTYSQLTKLPTAQCLAILNKTIRRNRAIQSIKKKFKAYLKQS